jgi:hypothetical protein
MNARQNQFLSVYDFFLKKQGKITGKNIIKRTTINKQANSKHT